MGERPQPGRVWQWLLAAALGAAVAACGSNSAVATAPTQLKCQVTLAAPPAPIGPGGGTASLTVTTSPECPWEVSTGANWLSGLSPASGQGPATVEFRAAPNPLPSARDAEIVVNEIGVRVSQQAAACRFELRSDSLTVDAGGGSREIALSAPSGCQWSAATDASWIAFTSPVTRSGDGIVTVDIAPNRGSQRRVGTIVVAGQRFTVTQESETAACVYVVSSSSQAVVPSGGGDVSGRVTVASGCPWTATSSVAWVTVLAGASATGSGSVAFRVASNPGGVRTAAVNVAGQTFTVTQAAAIQAPPVCGYSINPSSLAVGAAGASGSVAVSTGSGCAWTARSEDGWIRVSSGASGNGNGTVAFSVERNTKDKDRTGTVTIAGRTFTVRQQGKDD